MSTSTTRVRPDRPAGGVRPAHLALFGGIALATGWVLLSLPAPLGLPAEPFVLATLLLGLVLPALVLSSRESPRGARRLLRSLLRVPRHVTVLIPAALVIPALVWTIGLGTGVAVPLDAAHLGALSVELLSSLLIVNVWEELAWTGYFQSRVSALGGVVVGGIVTALLFAAVHLPLALTGVGDASQAATQVAILFASAVALRLAIGVLFDVTGGSILAVAVLHASFNASGSMVAPGHDLVRIGVVIVVGLAAVLVHALGRRAVRGEEVRG